MIIIKLLIFGKMSFILFGFWSLQGSIFTPCDILLVFREFSFLLPAAFSASQGTVAYLFLLWKAANQSTPAASYFAIRLS